MGILLFIIPLILVWYFLLRPQQKRARERAEMIARVQEGDEIVTAGGFVAIITELDAEGDTDLVRMELAEGFEVLAHRRAIAELHETTAVHEESDDAVEDADDLPDHAGPIEGDD